MSVRAAQVLVGRAASARTRRAIFSSIRRAHVRRMPRAPRPALPPRRGEKERRSGEKQKKMGGRRRRPVGGEKKCFFWEYDTAGSRVITDLSTNAACGCLTSSSDGMWCFQPSMAVPNVVVDAASWSAPRPRSSQVSGPARPKIQRPGALRSGCDRLAGLTERAAHHWSLSTYAKKATVSVLYWYEKLSGHLTDNLWNRPRKGPIFFCPLAPRLLAAA